MNNINEKGLEYYINKEDYFIKKSEEIYLEFINKIILYSSGIITTSITIFITLNDKLNLYSKKKYFIVITISSFLTMLLGLLIKLIMYNGYLLLSEDSSFSKELFIPNLNSKKIIENIIIIEKKIKKNKKIKMYILFFLFVFFLISNLFIIFLFFNLQ